MFREKQERAAHAYLPLVSLSVSSIRRSLFTVLKGYYDGGGNNNVRTVALAGYFAHDIDWPEFEAAWAEVLGSGPPMHASAAFHAEKEYEGWNVHESRARLAECISILETLDRSRFQSFSCVVPEYVFTKAKAQRARLRMKTIHAFCVDHCVGPMFRSVGFKSEDPNYFLKQIVFDQNERFRHFMNRCVRVRASLRPWWTPWCACVTEANAAVTLPLQAADVLAWTVYRHFSHGDCEDWYNALVRDHADPSAHVAYDVETLVSLVQAGD